MFLCYNPACTIDDEEKKDQESHNEELEEKKFVIHTYTKVELSMLYSPGDCVSVAENNLSRMIRSNRSLSLELAAVGYNKFRHSFTPKEVSILVAFLGEP